MAAGQKKKQFFFEKKNQKTFVRCPRVVTQTGSNGATRKE
jgi:hypothetical protein